MHFNGVSASFVFLALATVTNADGLYSKASAVLQVDGKSYNKLVAKSSQVSVSIMIVDTYSLTMD